MKQIGLVALYILGWVLISAGIGPAQTSDIYAESVDVLVVEVPVRVLRDGKPVRGLTREDFRLTDRGELRAITGFQVIDLAKDAATDSVSGSVPAVIRPRHLLLTFDFSFSRPNCIEVAISGARQMLSSQLHPTDKVAVALYASNSGARLLVGFTTDREKTALGLSFLEALLDRNPKHLEKLWSQLAELWGAGEAGSEESIEALNRLGRQVGLAAAFTLTGAFGLPELVDFEAYNAILASDSGQLGLEGWSPAMALIGPQLADQRAVDLEPGLAQIQWMSEAMAELVTLLRGVSEPKHMVYFSQGVPTEFLQNKELRTRAISAMDPMIRAFHATGWSLQAVDIEGIEDPLRASAIDAGQENFRHRDDLLMDFRPRGGSFAHKRGPGFDAQALFYLADETGGDLIENFNYIHQAVEVVLENTSVTYLLAFQPENVVAAKDSQLRIAIQAFAIGEDDSLLDLVNQEIRIDTTKVGAALEQTGFRFEGSLTLPQGSHRTRTLVRLLDTGERFLTTVPVQIRGPESADALLLPPLFVGRSSPYVTVRQRPETEIAFPTATIEPFSIGDERLTPVLSPAIGTGEEHLLLLTLFLEDGLAPRLSVRVLGQGGSEVGGGSFEWLVRDSENDAGATRLLGLFRPAGIDPGAYRLEMSLEGSDGEVVAAGSAPFAVVAATESGRGLRGSPQWKGQ